MGRRALRKTNRASTNSMKMIFMYICDHYRLIMIFIPFLSLLSFWVAYCAVWVQVSCLTASAPKTDPLWRLLLGSHRVNCVRRTLTVNVRDFRTIGGDMLLWFFGARYPPYAREIRLNHLSLGTNTLVTCNRGKSVSWQGTQLTMLILPAIQSCSSLNCLFLRTDACYESKFPCRSPLSADVR